MRKTLLIFALLWNCCPGYAFQTGDTAPGDLRYSGDTTDIPSTDQPNWEWGFTGGFLFSTVEGDGTDDHTYIPNFNFGVFTATEIFFPLGFRVELYYAGLGVGYASVADSKLRFNYLVLPGLFTYEFRPDFSLVLGPYFGYLLSAQDRGDDYKSDITDQIARLDIGVKIGVYYQVSPVLDLAVSFQRGFINTQSGERVSALKHYNQCVMFTTSMNISRMLNR